jgi:hypothetical protein
MAIRYGFISPALMADDCEMVRAEVVKRELSPENYIDDPHWFVRAEVARRGRYLDVLVKDESYIVRYAMAEAGHCVEILKDDNHPLVSIAASTSIQFNHYCS